MVKNLYGGFRIVKNWFSLWFRYLIESGILQKVPLLEKLFHKVFLIQIYTNV